MIRVMILALLALGCTRKPPLQQEINKGADVQPTPAVQPLPVGQPTYVEETEDVLNWPTGGTVLFSFDSYDTKEWKPNCGAYMGRICSVVGFACPIGDAGYNQSLSEARAHAVAEELKMCAVNELDVIGKGETEEFGSYEQNRRVEFVCVDGR